MTGCAVRGKTVRGKKARSAMATTASGNSASGNPASGNPAAGGTVVDISASVAPRVAASDCEAGSDAPAEASDVARSRSAGADASAHPGASRRSERLRGRL
jgi:hypothetical protein